MEEHVTLALKAGSSLSIGDYLGDQIPRAVGMRSSPIRNPQMRLIKRINECLSDAASNGAVMVGEDIHDPYGGAFKATKGIGSLYPQQVVSSPISEAAITGFGIGLGLLGTKAFVEIMFGDFLMNAMDQIVNNASKFFHMYAKQCGTNVTIRSPMGGGRGYGPTHSQSIEKLLLGLDNFPIYAVTSAIDPLPLFKFLENIESPSLLIENKMDYSKMLFQPRADLPMEFQIIGQGASTLVGRPWMSGRKADVTLVTYGGLGRKILDSFEEIFEHSDVIFNVFIVQALYPFPIQHFIDDVADTKRLLVVEEGSTDFGWGAEVCQKVIESVPSCIARRVGAKSVPIPSPRSLEDQVLVNLDDVILGLKSVIGGTQ